jgi:tetratricopeptide (TPR) repeat protein
MKKIIFIVFLFPFFLSGQDRTIDSLKLALKNAKHDTTRCNILNAMVDAEANDEIWSKYNAQLKTIVEKNITRKTEPKNFYLKQLGAVVNNIGYLAKQKGDIAKTLEFYSRSLKIYESIGDKEGLGMMLNNLGATYIDLGDDTKALEYFHKSLKIQKEIENKYGMGNALNNLGVISDRQGNLLKALEYYRSSLKIQEEIGDKEGIAYSLVNIGVIYNKQGNIPEAKDYFNRSLKIQEEVGSKEGITLSLINLATISSNQGHLKEALAFAGKGMQIAKESGFPESIKNSASTLTSIFLKQNKYKEAFEMYELEIKMRDSINNEETQKAAVKKQMQYQYETQARELKNEQEKKDLLAKAELNQREKERNYFIAGFALVIVLAGFIFRSYRQKQKANLIITQQKHEVEESRKEILDSIHYAKRIQKAHLPTQNYIEKNLNRLQNKG